VPHVLLIFDAFDHLLQYISPDLFPMEWWLSSDSKNMRLEMHYEIIELFNENGLHFPIENFRDGALQHVKLYSHSVYFHCCDFDEASHFAIPLFYWSNGRTVQTEPLGNLVKHITNIIQQKYSLSSDQAFHFTEHHLIMTYLIQQFSRNEKWGADFFTNDYPILLLQNAFKELNPIQAQRFYYWGILRFRVSDQIDYWISPDAFKNYLEMFKD
jgi:hypothetical protein